MKRHHIDDRSATESASDVVNVQRGNRPTRHEIISLATAAVSHGSAAARAGAEKLISALELHDVKRAAKVGSPVYE